jgi:K+-transporting ATPase A subunit
VIRVLLVLFLVIIIVGAISFGGYLTTALARARLREKKLNEAIENVKAALMQIENRSDDAFATNLAAVARSDINTTLNRPQEL